MSDPQSSLNKDLCSQLHLLITVRGAVASPIAHRENQEITSLKGEEAELELFISALSLIMFSKHVKNTYSASGTKPWWKQRKETFCYPQAMAMLLEQCHAPKA